MKKIGVSWDSKGPYPGVRVCISDLVIMVPLADGFTNYRGSKAAKAVAATMERKLLGAVRDHVLSTLCKDADGDHE